MPTPEAWVEQLRPVARAASGNAHAPFSRFRVGAVVCATDGEQFSGCNVESASYGLTQCAERNALGAAMAAGSKPRSLHTMLVYVPGQQVHAPCGACRQVISELMARDALVISCCDSDEFKAWGLADLLPDPFAFD